MASRRQFITIIASGSTVAVSGCSGLPIDGSGITGGSGPEAALEQYRTATSEGNAEAMNEVISAEGDFTQVEEGDVEDLDIEVIEYQINEVSVSEYESQTEEVFDEEAAQDRLSQTGGSEYAIVRWSEEFVDEEGEERSFEQYYLLHKVSGDWLIVDTIYTA